MRLELAPVPVSDADRAKSVYVERLGFREDVDVRPADGVRVVQLTPPGSGCSIVLGDGNSWTLQEMSGGQEIDTDVSG